MKIRIVNYINPVLATFWMGVVIVIGISIFFTFQNIQVINAIAMVIQRLSSSKI